MKKRLLINLLIIVGLVATAGFVFAKIEKDSDKDGLTDFEEQNVYNTNLNSPDSDTDSFNDGDEVTAGFSPNQGNDTVLQQVTLAVPYINEAPDNNWTGPWKNACEEASMAMVENYYLGQREVKISVAKNFMQAMFNRQNKIWGSNADADTQRTARLINDYTVYNAQIIDNPTIEDIKKELQQKRLVIVPLYGFDLQNKNIPFVPAPRGTSYHMLVIIGFDDTAEEFITNDSGDTKEGPNHRYGYDLLMNAIHDYSFVTKHADGPARVIFTYPKLVKTASYHRVYYLHDNIKQYITSPAVFAAHGWQWDAINIVEQAWLDAFLEGEDLIK